MNQEHSGKPMRFNLLLLGGCLAAFQWSTVAHACLLPSGCVIAAGDTARLIQALIEANAAPEADIGMETSFVIPALMNYCRTC